MPQHRITCIDKYDPKRKQSYFQICKGTTNRSHLIYIREPYTNVWTAGFKSYDRQGYVYYSQRFHRYMFTGVVIRDTEIKGYSNLGPGGRPLGRLMEHIPLTLRVAKGIEHEYRIVHDLNIDPHGYYIHHLPWSGIHSGGTDIVVSKHKEPETYTQLTRDGPKTRIDARETVFKGVCGIEVLGTVYHKRTMNSPRLIFATGKDLNVWRLDLIDHNVFPVIAWHHGLDCNYVLLTDHAYYHGCFVYPNRNDKRYKNKEPHQYSSRLPSERLSPFVFDRDMLFNFISSYFTYGDDRPLRDDPSFCYRSYKDYLRR